MATKVAKREQQQAPARDGGKTTAQELERTRMVPVFVPPADIYETKDHIVLQIEMPGVAPEDVDVQLERRVLTITGRTREQAHAGYRRIYTEYADGDYERVFTLSEDIDQEGIQASHRDGVLHLMLPKSEGAKARKIQLKSA